MTRDDILIQPDVQECIARGFIQIEGERIAYALNQKRTYSWADPEEWVRCATVAYLIIHKQYPPQRMRVEVTVPRRTPSDLADIVVYSDDRCKTPYLVVENKSFNQAPAARKQAIEQLFGNANSLRSVLALYDDGQTTIMFDVQNYPASERQDNRKGSKSSIPAQYGEAPRYTYIAGAASDIQATSPQRLESRIRRAHSLIWAGGKRDPLFAFDEWSKLLFAKVVDERNTRTGQPRAFQVGTGETTAAVANRIHERFALACEQDATIFPRGTRINLPDRKISDVVETLQDLSFVRTDVDVIGAAFESFFGSVFRGELGQYFTMRPLARFVVSMMDIDADDYCLDPTSGSGGFLLETLLQVWHRIDADYAGQPQGEIDRTKIDFALHKVFGVEIHDVLARICKINLLIHHDGHTNIDNRSCLDSTFSKARLNPPVAKFTKIVGNPPFGDEVRAGDEDHLGENVLENFAIADGREQVASEHIILERCIDLLEQQSNSRLGLVLPDGLFNNQGELSNCPRMRRILMKRGQIEAIVSLPDYAFRKSGAQNKTSVLMYRRFTEQEQKRFDRSFDKAIKSGVEEDEAIGIALDQNKYRVFLAEANFVGYTTTGLFSEQNDLYKGHAGGLIDDDQSGTILGEYRRFKAAPAAYVGGRSPDCMALDAAAMWRAHPRRRLDPKYHLFKREEREDLPDGWTRQSVRDVMSRREEICRPENQPETRVQVMTIAQTGEIRLRAAGKGRNPPEWLGMYFADSPSVWYQAKAGDVVFSSIDLWKGCVAVVPDNMDGALVTKEFPIYEVDHEVLDPDFLSTLLRSRLYQRAFRAITTGHSNRRRTQVEDFEALDLVYPESVKDQQDLIRTIMDARGAQSLAYNDLHHELLRFSDMIDGRGDEELPQVVTDDEMRDDDA